VSTLPPGQTCSLSGATGTATGGTIATVLVSCTANLYRIGASIDGLSGSLLLQDNGSDDLTVTAAGVVQFATPVAAGSAYAISVRTQPAGQQCSVLNGTGVVDAANVTAPSLFCLSGAWTWKGGATTSGGAGVYGTRGIAANSNQPGARSGASAWSDAAGNLTMFGGAGHDAAGLQGDLNDLWTYCVCNGRREWTWIQGGSVANAAGVYGVLTVAAVGNAPGARQGAATWTDGFGNLWLFGGTGRDSAGVTGPLNDLWKYTPSVGTWAWIAGSSVVAAAGVTAGLGVAAPTNVPGARQSASTWVDAIGDLWLFGGQGRDTAGASGPLNDLWRYRTSTNTWTWVSGASTTGDRGQHGTVGVTATTSRPGARSGAVAWAVPAGGMWLLGGSGLDGTGTLGELNDLWRYDAAAGTWTWVAGADVVNAAGRYGTRGTAAGGNTPGARQAAAAWIDPAGTFWLFGGLGRDGAGARGGLADLWKFSPGTANWTWVAGDSVAGAAGSPGTLNLVAVSNAPGARAAAFTWTDPQGKLWMSGGDDYRAAGSGNLNDLWEYTP
jgi:N-acetylneuraminic acid mutarotase